MATCNNDTKAFQFIDHFKNETEGIDLVSVRNGFIARHHERYSTFRKFRESDFV